MSEDEFDPIDFPPPERTTPAKLYLISPQEVGGTFPDRLRAAVDRGVAAAFQLRVKNVEEHALARLAEPLQRICADANVAFIVNDSMALAKRLGVPGYYVRVLPVQILERPDVIRQVMPIRNRGDHGGAPLTRRSAPSSSSSSASACAGPTIP